MMKSLTDKAFDCLTKKQKEVWELHMRDCFSEYATAKMLNLTRNAVHDRINKARKRYKTYIRLQRGSSCSI